MKITEISLNKVEIIYIEEDGKEHIYYRWSNNNWDVQMGESIEPVYGPNTLDALEKLYQEYKNEQQH